jgi:hypothetical protein
MATSGAWWHSAETYVQRERTTATTACEPPPLPSAASSSSAAAAAAALPPSSHSVAADADMRATAERTPYAREDSNPRRLCLRALNVCALTDPTVWGSLMRQAALRPERAVGEADG